MSVYSKAKGILEDYGKVIALLIAILVIGGILLAVGRSDAEVEGDYLKLKGAYGMSINIAEIESVTLQETLPENMRRNNGIDLFGRTYIGNFSSKELGKVKMFVRSNQKPYIHIVLKEGEYKHAFIALKDKGRTEEIYDILVEKMK